MITGFATIDSFSALLVFNNSLASSAIYLIILLALASFFIYKFYQSLSKKNILNLNLYKYNTSDHPIMSKVLAMLFYLIEYILFIPFLMLLWFAGLSIILLMIAKDGQSLEYILLISGAIIGATRILSYINAEISKDLAKLFPFITLSVFLLAPGNFNVETLITNAQKIPTLLGHVFSFIVVLLVIEIFLRVFYTLYEFWKSEGDSDETEEEKEE